mgnify:CR=1 FL=1
MKIQKKRSKKIDSGICKFNRTIRYAIDSNNDKASVMGVSMGGFGALRFTMLHPDEFGICVSFMAGISTKEQISQDSKEAYNKYHHMLYGENLKPEERANEFFIKNKHKKIADNYKKASSGRSLQVSWRR